MVAGLPTQNAVSAGGVVWRRDGSAGVEVVLCGRRSEAIWGLPKGTPDPGESLEQTAIREVEEETGLRVRIGARVGTIEYWFTAGGIRYHKRVHHWLMAPIGGDVADHDHEYDDVEWLPIAEAKARVSYENERRMIEEAERLVAPEA